LLILFASALIVVGCSSEEVQDSTNTVPTPAKMQHDPMSFSGQISVEGIVSNYGRFNFSLSSEDVDLALPVDYRGNQALPGIGIVMMSVLTGDQMPEAIPREVVSQIAALEGVSAAVPYLIIGASIDETLVTLTGILSVEMKEHRNWTVQAGTYFANDSESVVIGAGVATSFGLSVGDTLTFRGVNFPNFYDRI